MVAADDVRIDPPPPFLEQEFVAEDVGKRRWAAPAKVALIIENVGSGEDLVTITQDGPLRDAI